MLNDAAVSYLERRIRSSNVVYILLFLIINKCYYPCNMLLLPLLWIVVSWSLRTALGYSIRN